MSTAIIKYNAGNLFSVVQALRRLGEDPIVTDDRATLLAADRVLLPGQGNARTCMDYLQSHGLDQLIRSLSQPVLGICVGQQLLCRHSEEGDTDCIGIFDTTVRRFQPDCHEDKVPAMGWNNLYDVKSDLFAGLTDDSYAYFIHSFYVPVCPWAIAKTDYILPYSAALRKDNFFCTQFHPEKSGKTGEQILKNFLQLT